ncbi:MAG: ATP-dependent Clp protease ATP-binding subunit ClpX, partial [Planctomycetaceae bacterium]|nr:ATP-dependent Clp protease ATP-binding subunit ClpX [Planctomycetaceae bacterium]
IRVMSEPKNALVKQYKRLFQMEDADVEFTESALVAIAKKALEKKTGARGLRSIVENVMLDIMYELPDLPAGEVYRVTEDVVEGRETVLPIKESEPLTKIA